MSEAWDITKDLVAGTVGGCAGIAAGQPLDTIKVRMQSSHSLYRGMIDCGVKTVRKEGVLALYKGMTSPLVGNAPMNALVFSAYGNATRMLDRWFPDGDGTTKLFAAGTWAGLVQSLVASPVELVKCKLQVQNNSKTVRYNGSWDCLRQVYRSNGLRGVASGVTVTMMRDGPGFGAYFATYELVKDYLSGGDEKKVSDWMQLVAGGCAGVVTWVVTYPCDVVKSVIQTVPEEAPAIERSIIHVSKTQYQKHGWQFFFRGLTPTVVRSVPANAVTFYVYELTLKFLSKYD